MSFVRGGPGSSQVFLATGVTKNQQVLIGTLPVGNWNFTVTEPMFIYIDSAVSTPVIVVPGQSEQIMTADGDVDIWALAVKDKGDVSVYRIRRDR